MNRRAIVLAVLLAAGCASGGGAVTRADGAIALRNAGFEAPARLGERCPADWSCTMHSNADSFRFSLDASNPAEGRQSLCVERVIGEPWAVASQPVAAQALRGRRLRFSIAMRAERLDGEGAGPWVMVNGAQGMIAHEERVSRIGGAWERRTIEFHVPPKAEALELGATLIGGGRVCLDDARLEPA